MAANDEIQPNPGNPLAGQNTVRTKQDMRNAQGAYIAEHSINPALGAGWAEVGSAAQSKANPKGVGKIPSGATSLRAGLTPILPPRARRGK